MTLFGNSFMFVRTGAIVAFALIAFLVPAIGDNRFLLAGILVFVCLPLAVWVQVRYPVEETGWSEPLFDLVGIVVLIHIVPDAWYLGLLVGAMLLGAAGITASRLGYKFYVLLLVILIVGMSFAAIVHDVDGWVPAILVVLLLFPTVFLYANLQAQRLGRLNQRAQELESLTLLAGGVAHDFNNLLTTVTGNTELALQEIAVDHPGHKLLNAAIDGAMRASMLSGQLLAFSGRKIATKTIVDIGSEMTAIASLMERAIPKGITLALQSAHDQFFVECDQAQIQQVVMNIILNAAESITTVPSIVWLSLKLERKQSDDGRWVVLEVRDEGVGIPSDMISSSFDPFVTSKPSGHGLGLASAKRVIEEHGGHIAIESQQGVGTKVCLWLPAVREPSEPTVSVAGKEFRETGLVLVIDDEGSVRDLISRFAERLGFRTIQAQDGYEGTTLFQKRSAEFVAVVLDLKMPGKDGWECFRELREIRLNIPVIIISGYNPDKLQADDHNLAFLAKPCRLDDMERAFRSVLPEDLFVANN